jgi:hypothetical protein
MDKDVSCKKKKEEEEEEEAEEEEEEEEEEEVRSKERNSPCKWKGHLARVVHSVALSRMSST